MAGNHAIWRSLRREPTKFFIDRLFLSAMLETSDDFGYSSVNDVEIGENALYVQSDYQINFDGRERQRQNKTHLTLMVMNERIGQFQDTGKRFLIKRILENQWIDGILHKYNGNLIILRRVH
jgi:hypothetical protein